MGWINLNVLESILEVDCGCPVTLMGHVGQLHEPVELELGDTEEGVEEAHVYYWVKFAVLLGDDAQW